MSDRDAAGFGITLGIDLASQPRNTGLCAIEWGPEGGTVLALARGSVEAGPLTDYRLAQAMQGDLLELGGVPPRKIAIDAPFGWPQPFVQALQARHQSNGWPLGLGQPRAPLERRATDRFVWAQTQKTALSVSTDKIAFPAMRCAALLADFRRTRGARAADLAGAGVVVEVYPDPAIRHWTRDAPQGLGLRESYKGPERVERRRQLTEITSTLSGLADPDQLLGLCATYDDCLDALICALVGRAAELKRTLAPTRRDDCRLAKTEGWIHLPNCGLEEL